MFVCCGRNDINMLFLTFGYKLYLSINHNEDLMKVMTWRIILSKMLEKKEEQN